ncbi:MAG TPA: hypothetical protein PKA05_15160 [Roseiflexaceae bacterium]|nr:hypothetical protein [Roseiflexaceae bacterium]
MHTLLAAEVRHIRAWLGAPAFWLVLCVSLLCWLLAFQVAAPVVLHLGGDRATQLRWYDEPFLTGFNAPEPGVSDWWRADVPYRWASDNATLRFAGMGGDQWRMAVHAASGRGDGTPILSRWQIGSAAPIELPIDATPRVYRLIGPADAGDLQLQITTPRYVVADDPRNLGLVIFRVALAPLTSSPAAPALPQLGLLAAIAAAGFAVVSRLSGANRRLSGAATMIMAGYLGLLLITQRAELGMATPALALLTWALYPLALLLPAATARLTRALGVPVAGWEVRAAAAAWLAGFGVRMAGLLNPFARFSDLGLNVNNLTRTLFGELFLTTGLPCEAGAGPQPYPPGLYLVLAPARLLIGDDRLQIGRVIQGGVALLESAAAVVIWLALRHAGVERRAALAAAALMIAAPPMLRSYSIGEMANLFGQALVAPLLLALLVGLTRRDGVLIAAVCVAVAFLGHTGVTLSVAALIAIWLLLHVAGRQWRILLHNGTWLAIAGLVAITVFYSAFLYIPAARSTAAAELAAQGVICPPGRPLDAKLGGIAASTFTPAAIVSPLLLVGGAFGALLLVASRRTRSLGMILAACWISVALSFVTLLNSDQTVRWQLFLYPALCVGIGALCAPLLQRGRAGVLLDVTLVGWLISRSLIQWWDQIARYLH